MLLTRGFQGVSYAFQVVAGRRFQKRYKDVPWDYSGVPLVTGVFQEFSGVHRVFEAFQGCCKAYQVRYKDIPEESSGVPGASRMIQRVSGAFQRNSGLF